MSETKVSEPKPGPDGTKVRKVRRNRKNYGEIVLYPQSTPRVCVYWSTRRLDQYHRLTEGWLFEADTISAVRLYGVTHVGLLIEDGSKLLMPIEVFGPAGLEEGAVRARSNTYVDPWGRRGAMCWHIPERLCVKHEPDDYISTELLLARMHQKRDRSRRTVEEALAASKT